MITSMFSRVVWLFIGVDELKQTNETERRANWAGYPATMWVTEGKGGRGFCKGVILKLAIEGVHTCVHKVSRFLRSY